MKVVRLTIQNFRGISHAVLDFQGHTLLVGANNVGKSTICEALDLVLGPDRLNRTPAAQEHDFFNAQYLPVDGSPRQVLIEVVLTDLSPEALRLCAANVEQWHRNEKRLLSTGELTAVDAPEVSPCLRLQAIVTYDPDEDDFAGATYFAHPPAAPDGALVKVPQKIKRSFGFLYLRALRTGSRALSLERGSLLDIILRMKEARTGLWEGTRQRLKDLNPPIDGAADELGRVLQAIEARVAEYIPLAGARSTRLFVSQLTREHLRRTLTFFLSTWPDQEPVPFQNVGTGTLNILVLALLTFIGDTKPGNVIFAMEEPEIALPPHTQRRIAKYLLSHSAQCFITTHSPYVIECFAPEQISVLRRSTVGGVNGHPLALPAGVKMSTYRGQLRRAIAEAILGKGVLVCEGISEQLALRVAAGKLEEADGTLFPLDVAGVSIVSNDGDGNLSELGSFFRSAGLVTMAFYDKKTRRPEEQARMIASYDMATESSYVGLERLLSEECPLDRQWDVLEEIRAEDSEERLGIPVGRPSSEDELRDLTVRILKGMKGTGGASRLIERCEVAELPETLLAVLRQVYERFPKPADADLRAEAGTPGEPGGQTAAAPSGS